MSPRVLRRCWLPVGLGFALAPSLVAQVRASERGSVSQTIDGTVITLDYARPQVRGRSPIFGGFVRWKEVWTPGANFATTLETNRKFALDGHDVAPGKYSVWFKVEPEQWTLILDPHVRLYHTDPPDSADGQLRWIVHPAEGPITEVLTFSFPVVRPTGGTLQFNWGRTALAMSVAVEPKHHLDIAAADAAPYLGKFRFHWSDGSDTTSGPVAIAYQNGMLIAKWDPKVSPGGDSSVLVRTSDDMFLVGTFEKGVLTDIMTEMVLDFSRTAGRVSGFDARDEKDAVIGSGKREEKK